MANDESGLRPPSPPASPPPLEVSLEQRIRCVADRAQHSPYFVWDWGEAIAMDGLLAASEATGDDGYRNWVWSRLDLWRQIHPDPFWPDHLGPGVALVQQLQLTGDPEVRAYAERLARHLMSLPRARTGARLLRPDKPDIQHFVWVDSLYTDGPFLCSLGRAIGNEEYTDEGARHMEGICASLQDPATGLFAHRYDDTSGDTNGVFWGRGCGWAALGLGHTLALLSNTHPAWSGLQEHLYQFATTAVTMQSTSGHWHAVFDRPETLPESSTTALIAEGLARGIETGALGNEFVNVVERAWSAVVTEVQPDGVVQNVSQRSPSSPKWEDYANLPHGGCYAWGQGPWLLLACRNLVSGAARSMY